MTKVQIDLRSALRALSTRRGSSAAIVIVAAVGVGLASAMFALADPFILRPLPYSEPGRLAAVTWAVDYDTLSRGDTIPTLQAWKDRHDIFADAAAVSENTFQRQLDETAGFAELTCISVSPGLFDLLGVAGVAADAHAAVPRNTDEAAFEVPIVLTEKGARKLAAAVDGRVTVGRGLRLLSGGSLRVVGILPSAFVFPSARPATQSIEALVLFDAGPFVTFTSDARSRSIRVPVSTVVGRLQPGVTPDLASRALSQRLESGVMFLTKVESLPDLMTRGTRRLGWGALAAGILTLLVCAGNVANLFLMRWEYRDRELAVRSALGASIGDLTRLMVIEAGVLASAAFIASLSLTHGALEVARSVIPAEYARLGVPSMTWRVAAFGSLATAVVLFAGVLPTGIIATGRALRRESSRLNSYESVMRFVFTSVQCAVAMILACGATLLMWSYVHLIRQDSGYDHSTLLISLRQRPPRDPEPVLQALRRIPGIRSAAAIHGPLVEDGAAVRTVYISGQQVSADLKVVTSEFFDAAGTPVVAGRSFTRADLAGGAAIVDEAFARRHWPGRSPLGEFVSFGTRSALTQAQVVGIVRNTYDRGLALPPTPTLYISALDERTAPMWRFVVRAQSDSINYDRSIRRGVADSSAGVTVSGITTIGQRLADSIRDKSFAAVVFSWFGVAAITIAVLGIAGTVGFLVARRTREIAVHIALGAQWKDVWVVVVRETAVAALCGIVAGLALGRAASRVLAGLVYEVSVGTWTLPTVVAFAIMALVIAAAVIPMRRAFRIQPTIALKSE